MLYYSYTQTISLILLYCWYSYCVLFCALLDGVCLSGNNRITYLLTRSFFRQLLTVSQHDFTPGRRHDADSHQSVQPTGPLIQFLHIIGNQC